MITISSTFLGFKNFFKGLLTSYQLENDSYKDSNGEGLFERYMALFGESIDNEQASQIDNYLNIIDASICEEKFLTHISDVLGNPPDVFLNTDQYRNLLLYITNVYKVKGTTRGYLLFFYILGYDVLIEEIEPYVRPLKYDNTDKYDYVDDYDTEQIRFDRETCQACSLYNIRIKSIDETDYTLDSALLIKMTDAIKFNEPINARLGKFVIVIVIEDELDLTVTDEDITYNIDYHYLYDTPLVYDDPDAPLPDYDSEDVDEDE